MKLFYTPLIGLVHKVQVVAIEAGVYDDLEKVPTIPYDQGEELVAANPLSKVPTLLLDDGTPLFGGPVIYEYLDSLHDGPKMFPPQDSVERFISLRSLTLGDNIFDIINIRSIERDRPPGHVVTKYLTRLENQIRRAIDRADAEAESYSGFTIGQISIACGLHYHDWQRGKGSGLEDWRTGRTRLVKWFDRFTSRPSFVPRDEEAKAFASRSS